MEEYTRPVKSFDCDISITLLHGILTDSMHYSMKEECPDVNVLSALNGENFNWSSRQLDEKLSQACFFNLIGKLKQLIANNYEIRIGYCEDFEMDSCEWRAKAIHETVFYNVLQECHLITDVKIYFYESILNIFHDFEFGAYFYLNLVCALQWKHYFVEAILSQECTSTAMKLIKYFESQLNEYHFRKEHRLYLYSTLELSALRLLLRNMQNSEIIVFFEEISRNFVNFFIQCDISVQKSLQVIISFYKCFCEDVLTDVIVNCSSSLNLHKEYNFALFKNGIDAELKFPFYPINLQHIHKKFSGFIESLLPRIQSVINCRTIPAVLEELKEISGYLDGWSFIRQGVENRLPDLQNICLIECIESSLNLTFSSMKINYAYFSDYIKNKKLGYRFLIICLFRHGNLAKHKSLLEIITPEMLTDPRILVTVAESLQEINSKKEYESEKDLFTKKFKEAICAINNLKHIKRYFKLHVNKFNLKPLGDIDSTRLIILRNKIPAVDLNSKIAKDAKLEFMAYAFINPLAVLNFLLNDCVCNTRCLIPFVSDLCCNELSELCAWVDLNVQNLEWIDSVNSLYETLFILMLHHKIQSTNDPMDMMAISELIKVTYFREKKCKKAKNEMIMNLESLFCALLNANTLGEETSVANKVQILRLVVKLGDNDQWQIFDKYSALIMYHMLQYIDYYWYDGSKKSGVLCLLNSIMRHRMMRKLTLDDIAQISHQMDACNEETLMLAYLEPCLELNLQYVLNIKEAYQIEILMLSAICTEQEWIHEEAQNFLVYSRCTEELARVIRFFTLDEWKKLVNFLQRYYQITAVIPVLCDAIQSQDTEAHAINWRYVIHCICAIVEEYFINLFEESKEMQSEYSDEWESNVTCFKAFGGLLVIDTKDDDKKPVVSVLNRMAEIIKEQKTPIYKYYSEKSWSITHPLIKNILVANFGPKAKDTKVTEITFAPI